VVRVDRAIRLVLHDKNDGQRAAVELRIRECPGECRQDRAEPPLAVFGLLRRAFWRVSTRRSARSDVLNHRRTCASDTSCCRLAVEQEGIIKRLVSPALHADGDGYTADGSADQEVMVARAALLRIETSLRLGDTFDEVQAENSGRIDSSAGTALRASRSSQSDASSYALRPGFQWSTEAGLPSRASPPAMQSLCVAIAKPHVAGPPMRRVLESR
jgi:hypothetical protein